MKYFSGQNRFRKAFAYIDDVTNIMTTFPLTRVVLVDKNVSIIEDNKYPVLVFRQLVC